MGHDLGADGNLRLPELAPTGRQLALLGTAVLALVGGGAQVLSRLERGAALESRAVYSLRLQSLVESGNFSAPQEAIVRDIIRHHGYHWCQPHMAHEDPWSVEASMYFVVVLISTIGYGDLAPETVCGKVVAVAVSLVGIPLLLSFTVPLAQKLVGALTRQVRRWYITRAVLNAMEAVDLQRRGGSAPAVLFSRRLPTLDGVGLNHGQILRVEVATLLLLVSIAAMAIAGLSLLLSRIEGWAAEDSLSFVWYTVTTVGLGDKTIDLNHPRVAMALIVVLLLLGTSGAQALMHITHRAAVALEEHWFACGGSASGDRWAALGGAGAACSVPGEIGGVCGPSPLNDVLRRAQLEAAALLPAAAEEGAGCGGHLLAGTPLCARELRGVVEDAEA